MPGSEVKDGLAEARVHSPRRQDDRVPTARLSMYKILLAVPSCRVYGLPRGPGPLLVASEGEGGKEGGWGENGGEPLLTVEKNPIEVGKMESKQDSFVRCTVDLSCLPKPYDQHHSIG